MHGRRIEVEDDEHAQRSSLTSITSSTPSIPPPVAEDVSLLPSSTKTLHTFAYHAPGTRRRQITRFGSSRTRLRLTDTSNGLGDERPSESRSHEKGNSLDDSAKPGLDQAGENTLLLEA